VAWFQLPVFHPVGLLDLFVGLALGPSVIVGGVGMQELFVGLAHGQPNNIEYMVMLG
jgi:hypothetical protein